MSADRGIWVNRSKPLARRIYLHVAVEVNIWLRWIFNYISMYSMGSGCFLKVAILCMAGREEKLKFSDIDRMISHATKIPLIFVKKGKLPNFHATLHQDHQKPLYLIILRHILSLFLFPPSSALSELTISFSPYHPRQTYPEPQSCHWLFLKKRPWRAGRVWRSTLGHCLYLQEVFLSLLLDNPRWLNYDVIDKSQSI